MFNFNVWVNEDTLDIWNIFSSLWQDYKRCMCMSNAVLSCIVDLIAFGMLVEFLVGHPKRGVCTLKMVLLQLWFLTRDPLAVVCSV